MYRVHLEICAQWVWPIIAYCIVKYVSYRQPKPKAPGYERFHCSIIMPYPPN